jgi:hypothetical protein
MIDNPFLFAAGDWGLDALFRRAAKRENPVDPVNPVQNLITRFALQLAPFLHDAYIGLYSGFRGLVKLVFGFFY